MNMLKTAKEESLAGDANVRGHPLPQVYHNAGEPHERRYARKIEPLIRRRHLLLVTLLIMNAACLEVPRHRK